MALPRRCVAVALGVVAVLAAPPFLGLAAAAFGTLLLVLRFFKFVLRFLTWLSTCVASLEAYGPTAVLVNRACAPACAQFVVAVGARLSLVGLGLFGSVVLEVRRAATADVSAHVKRGLVAQVAEPEEAAVVDRHAGDPLGVGLLLSPRHAPVDAHLSGAAAPSPLDLDLAPRVSEGAEGQDVDAELGHDEAVAYLGLNRDIPAQLTR